jgi:predicted LPLAT superfamily acyltransferase
MTAIPMWRAQRERGSRLLMRVLVAVALKAGRPVGRALLYPICAYFLLFSGHARAASRDYLRRVLGRAPSWRERFRHYHCFAGQILDRVHFLTDDPGAFDCSIEGQEVFDAAIARGRGVLLIGAHLGSFEVMRVAALARSPVRLRVLMHEQNAEKLTSVLTPLNANLGRQIIALGRPQTMLEVRDALGAGEVVGLLADRVVTGDRVHRCEFFGQPASFAEGPFILAAAVSVPVVLFSAVQTNGRRYRIRFEAFADRVELPRDAREAALQRTCERYAAWLEARCREAPYNWFNFYDFWGAETSAIRH